MSEKYETIVPSEPDAGERLQWGGFGFEIVDMDGARIDKILITRIPEDPAQEV